MFRFGDEYFIECIRGIDLSSAVRFVLLTRLSFSLFPWKGPVLLFNLESWFASFVIYNLVFRISQLSQEIEWKKARFAAIREDFSAFLELENSHFATVR